MEFILPFHIPVPDYKISYADKIFLIGSCFSEEIGEHLANLKFNVLQNPNGILYDPLSISYALNSYVDNKRYDECGLFSTDDLWHSWHHHSVFSGTDKHEVLQKINQSQSRANAFLKNAACVIITLGTAYNYQLKSNNEFIGNCHKAPASLFQKNLMETVEIISRLSQAIKNLQSYNPGVTIIFTISPVRHVRDGVIENNRSKARLIDAVHSIKENNDRILYFPAYELVIDILRDYRFYKSDLVHANELAVQYVFESFCNTFFNEATTKLM
ncbi:MAG: GSCFA domain-containing protein, partial [Bacteroidota bacterium]|nr:GSCFA domain-containing protein [Bacteroidota bacterium]